MDLAKKRQSTRGFSAKPVARELIDSCLEAARLAPSACNSQPWSFLVLEDKKKKDELTSKAFSGVYSMNSFAKNAPVLIVVVTEKSTYAARLGGMLRNVKYNLIDIGVAGDHLTLQAEELGLGTCWLGWFNEKAVKKVLNLPRSTRIDILFALGYPEKQEEKIKVRKSMEEVRRYLD